MAKPSLFDLRETLKPIIQEIAKGSLAQKMIIEQGGQQELSEHEQLLKLYRYITEIGDNALKMQGLLYEHVQQRNEKIESYLHGSRMGDVEEDPF